jgi:predicted methyltransferase
MMRSAAVVLMLVALAAPAFAQPGSAPIPTELPDQIEPCEVCVKEKLELPQLLQKALRADDRSMEHRLRDENRQVRKIIETAWPTERVVAGSRVLDVASGGGYLAIIFSSLVGEGGHVDIHNTPGWIAQFPGMDPDMQRNWIKRPNIGWVTAGWNDLDAPDGSYDFILLGQVYHDVVFEGGDFEALNERFFDMLSPGGRVIIEDHDAIETMPLMQQANLHRISHGDVIGDFLAAGFRQVAFEEIESRYDDRKMNVFWPNVRGRTDRYILVFEKSLDGKPLR